MTTFIFVYERTNFRVGDHEVKRFDFATNPRQLFASATTVMAAGAAGDLERGIYGVLSDDNVAIDVQATDPTRLGVTFDLVGVKGKDKWPGFASEAQLRRVRATFPVSDDDIDHFLGARAPLMELSGSLSA